MSSFAHLKTQLCRGTTCSWRSAAQEQCGGSLLLHQSKSKSLKWYFLSFSTFLLLILRTPKARHSSYTIFYTILLDFIYHFLHNTHRVPKFDVRLKHNTILMHYNVSITCIACTSSISTHAQPVTMATEATWCLSECVLELQHQSLPSQWALRGRDKNRTLLRCTGI